MVEYRGGERRRKSEEKSQHRRALDDAGADRRSQAARERMDEGARKAVTGRALLHQSDTLWLRARSSCNCATCFTLWRQELSTDSVDNPVDFSCKKISRPSKKCREIGGDHKLSTPARRSRFSRVPVRLWKAAAWICAIGVGAPVVSGRTPIPVAPEPRRAGAGHSLHLTTSTGIVVWVSTFCVSLPMRKPDMPRRPCDAITIRSQCCSRAIRMMAS